MLKLFFDIGVLLTDGLAYSAALFAITLIGSMPLGLMLTFSRMGNNRLIGGATATFVYVMRGTPLLLQLYFFYYGLPFLPGALRGIVVLDRFPSAALAFVLNYAAYFCEIFRGGLLSIDSGQYEAAQVLGFSRTQTLFKIELPQMLRVTLPSIANECITLTKDTALVTAIGITEVLYFARATVNRQASPAPYAVAALFFLFFNFLLTKLFDYLEKRLSY